ARLIDTPFAEAFAGRSALIVDDDGSAGVCSLLEVAIRSPRRHILLTTSREAPAGGTRVVLSRLPPESLAAAVLPASLASAPAVRQAAVRANGVPGAFIDLLRGNRAERGGPTRVSRAAEHTPAYGAEDRPAAPLGGAAVPARTSWPAPGELASLRRVLNAALAHLRA